MIEKQQHLQGLMNCDRCRIHGRTATTDVGLGITRFGFVGVNLFFVPRALCGQTGGLKWTMRTGSARPRGRGPGPTKPENAPGGEARSIPTAAADHAAGPLSGIEKAIEIMLDLVLSRCV